MNNKLDTISNERLSSVLGGATPADVPPGPEGDFFAKEADVKLVENGPPVVVDRGHGGMVLRCKRIKGKPGFSECRNINALTAGQE